MEPQHKSAHRFGVPRYSTAKLLVALGLLFVFTPFIEDLPRGDLIEAILLTLVMVSSVLAVGARSAQTCYLRRYFSSRQLSSSALSYRISCDSLSERPA